MKKIAVSACLLGVNCKYNGLNNYCEDVVALRDRYEIIPICPETSGGLPTPRNPSEIIGQKVVSDKGNDVTENFTVGANTALETVLKNGCKFAVLKEGSPSCGVNYIYDGSFSGRKICGMGITAKLLKENGIKVISEKELNSID